MFVVWSFDKKKVFLEDLGYLLVFYSQNFCVNVQMYIHLWPAHTINLLNWCKVWKSQWFSTYWTSSTHIISMTFEMLKQENYFCRYGLPVNFQAMLLQPMKKSQRRLKEVLAQLYSHLDNTDMAINDVRFVFFSLYLWILNCISMFCNANLIR